jgi:hypothetical protein
VFKSRGVIILHGFYFFLIFVIEHVHKQLSGMKGYNRKNILQRKIDIQNTTLEHTLRGVTQEWVYENIIFPTYRISRATYYNYLAENAKANLKKLEEAEQMQTSLF